MKRACACVKKDSDAEVLWEQQSYSEKKKVVRRRLERRNSSLARSKRNAWLALKETSSTLVFHVGQAYATTNMAHHKHILLSQRVRYRKKKKI